MCCELQYFVMHTYHVYLVSTFHVLCGTIFVWLETDSAWNSMTPFSISDHVVDFQFRNLIIEKFEKTNLALNLSLWIMSTNQRQLQIKKNGQQSSTNLLIKKSREPNQLNRIFFEFFNNRNFRNLKSTKWSHIKNADSNGAEVKMDIIFTPTRRASLSVFCVTILTLL